MEQECNVDPCLSPKVVQYSDSGALTDTFAVIVHHDSLATLGLTVAAIIQCGVLPEHIVIVDNSEDSKVSSQARSMLPSEACFIQTENEGYAAAVNRGVEVLSMSSGSECGFVLVATHEVLPDVDAVRKLRRILLNNADVAACGPRLVNDNRVWSDGGKISRFLRIPYHASHGAPISTCITDDARNVSSVAWLDGAFVLYRGQCIREWRLPEEYFLYMEEVDYHLSLARRHWVIACDRSVVVSQSSSGIPDYFLGRSMVLYQQKYGSRMLAIIAVVYLVARRAASQVRGRRVQGPNVGEVLRGALSGFSNGTPNPRSAGGVGIVNPLGAALRHYREELVEVLRRQGKVKVLEQYEPSSSDKGRWRWLLLHYSAVLRMRFSPVRTFIVVWPPLGYLDVLLTRLLGGRRGLIVIHDAVPLVRSLGYGRLVRGAVRHLRFSNVIVHSDEAAIEAPLHLSHPARVVPHPMLMSGVDSKSRSDCGVRIVLVFGQFKRDRNVQLMEQLAIRLAPYSLDLRVVGRGWPPVRGWSVDSRFVDEAEVNSLLGSADVVLIPYVRFYQSGVAVRCVENGTPFVGPDQSALRRLLGDSSPLLASNEVDDWLRAILFALNAEPDYMECVFSRYKESVVSGWREGLKR